MQLYRCTSSRRGPPLLRHKPSYTSVPPSRRRLILPLPTTPFKPASLCWISVSLMNRWPSLSESMESPLRLLALLDSARGNYSHGLACDLPRRFTSSTSNRLLHSFQAKKLKQSKTRLQVKQYTTHYRSKTTHDAYTHNQESFWSTSVIQQGVSPIISFSVPTVEDVSLSSC